MNNKIKALLNNKGGNYIFPFFWQHGEEEAVLREYMQAIDENNIKAVCVESRPHPDYCGPKWWEDMDIILDEARKRNMQVWILDDSHFPTGYANGAMTGQADERCRQSICCRTYDLSENKELRIEKEALFHPDPFQPTQLEMHIGDKNPRVFNDDKLLALFAIRVDEEGKSYLNKAERINLMPFINEDTLEWNAPEGSWKVYALHLSRNMGYHRSYINMMDEASCRVLIDAVYEPHYTRYKDDFGTTIAGFFSDEPELGNGHLYEKNVVFGSNYDFPWSAELEEALKASLGEDFNFQLALLWEENASESEKAKVRYTYMDQVTKLVEKDFSRQLGDWCREHGVSYIGHLIEDNNQHSRTGSSLGHFFRGLAGQDMSGIDNIGGQVLPQGEDLDYNNGPFATRTGEFYHYMLGKLGSSAAAIEPLKKGNAMCEIFGAYGWSAGLRLEKYLLDHFLVRGINNYVPHAYSAKAYPDPDCPPHFYAGGHNPQHRHFGKLMAYTNRVCELISGGVHIAPVAVLYHGEAEWTGKYMVSHKIGHILADAQIDYDYIPQDVFAKPEAFKTEIKNGVLKVNTQEYKTFIVPTTQFITADFAEAVAQMKQSGILVYFVEALPEGICDVKEPSKEAKLLAQISKCQVIKLEEIIGVLKDKQIHDINITPSDNRIRYYHYEHADGSGVYLFVNEGTNSYNGQIELSDTRKAYFYNPWDNCLESADYNGKVLAVTIHPLKSLILVLDNQIEALDELKAYLKPVITAEGQTIEFSEDWKRSICRSIEYPAFKAEKIVSLPDNLAEEEPEFSGYVRYENNFIIDKKTEVILEITDAHEGVEVFVNGSSFGIQIVPNYLFDITEALKEGVNNLVIEIATTLERENANTPNMFGQKREATGLTGITGEVKLYEKYVL
jgi:hypothetical protein